MGKFLVASITNNCSSSNNNNGDDIRNTTTTGEAALQKEALMENGRYPRIEIFSITT